jgi:hypothetical protein
MRPLEESRTKAVDLDGTLADDSVIDMMGYKPELIGPPIPAMVKRVKVWLDKGTKVVIFTARVHPGHGLAEAAMAEKAIKEWCMEVFGRELEVTCMKDPAFGEIWDDKAVRVDSNNGTISDQSKVVDPLENECFDSIGSFFS